MFFENRSQLLHEVREFVRQASVMSPPGQPLQGLIENDGGEVATKTLPVHRLSRFGLIRFEVRGLQGVPLLPGPLAGAEAHQIEAARTQPRRFRVARRTRGNASGRSGEESWSGPPANRGSLRESAPPIGPPPSSVPRRRSSEATSCHRLRERSNKDRDRPSATRRDGAFRSALVRGRIDTSAVPDGWTRGRTLGPSALCPSDAPGSGL